MHSKQVEILLIEDDLQTRRIIKSSLCGHGWKFSEAANGNEGISVIKSGCPDMIILDLGLPDMDGLTVMHNIKPISEVPILILSARSQELEKIQALDAGADDYVTKPFGIGELEARIRALLRRLLKPTKERQVFPVGNIIVDLNKRMIYRDGTETHLTPIEHRLLRVLMGHAGLVVTHRQLLREVWGPEHVDDIHYLRIYMGQLRHKLEVDPTRPKYLMTEVGVGYRFIL